MSKMIDYLKAAAGEASLTTKLGFWRQAVSGTVDNLVDLVALITGGGLLPATGTTQGSRPLSGYSTALLQTGDEVFVQGINEVYYFDANSALVADGLNVVNAVGPGQFIRGSTVVVQADWYVDSVNGNDQNAGTAAAPLKTLLELTSRVSGRRILPTVATVNLLGTFPTQDLSLSVDLPHQGTFNINGQVTQQASGSTTSFTQINPAGSAPASFNSASIADFTPYLGMRIRWTSGAGNGATAWILKATAANVARISIPLTIDAVRKTPAAGNTFVIEDLTCVVRTAILNIRGGGNKAAFVPASYVTNLALANPNNQDHQFTGQGQAAYGLWVSWCRFQGSTYQLIKGEAGWQGNLNSGQDLFFQGSHTIYGHFGLGGGTGFIQARVFFGEDCFCQNGDFAVNNSDIISSANIGIADRSSTSAIQIGSGSQLAFVTGGKVAWGTNNTGAANFGVFCGDNAMLLYATKPTVTSGGGDAKLGATVRTWAQIPYRDGYDGVTVGTGTGAMITVRHT